VNVDERFPQEYMKQATARKAKGLAKGEMTPEMVWDVADKARLNHQSIGSAFSAIFYKPAVVQGVVMSVRVQDWLGHFSYWFLLITRVLHPQNSDGKLTKTELKRAMTASPRVANTCRHTNEPVMPTLCVLKCAQFDSPDHRCKHSW